MEKSSVNTSINPEMKKEELKKEIQEITDEVEELYKELHAEVKRFERKFEPLFTKPLFGRLILYALLQKDKESLKTLISHDKEVNKTLLQTIRALDEEIESLSNRIEELKKVLDGEKLSEFKKEFSVVKEQIEEIAKLMKVFTTTYQELDQETKALKEEIRTYQRLLSDDRKELEKKIKELKSSLTVEFGKGDKKRSYPLPLLMRQMFFELASAVDERKRVLEAHKKLDDLVKLVNPIGTLVYSDLPKVLKQNKEMMTVIKILMGLTVGLALSQLVLFGLILFR